eukprot:scaffold38500_cov28-Tisochrysis_lutea.AAC.2
MAIGVHEHFERALFCRRRERMCVGVHRFATAYLGFVEMTSCLCAGYCWMSRPLYSCLEKLIFLPTLLRPWSVKSD